MYVIVTANLKGGVGKSTAAINLAICFHQAGAKTLLVDGDSQGTVRTWRTAAKEGADLPEVKAMDAYAIGTEIPRWPEDRYDVVIIDTPARMGGEAKAAMLVADLVLMPIVPGAADVWALQETLDVYEVVQRKNTALDARILLNRADYTNMGALVADKLDEFGVELLSATLGDRVAFREAMLSGQGVTDWEPSSVAADEMRALHRQIRKLMNDGPRKPVRRTDARAAATARS